MVRILKSLLLSLAAIVAACDRSPEAKKNAPIDNNVQESWTALELNYASTFNATWQGDFWVVDLKASIASWGGEANGPEQAARVLLVPHSSQVPALEGPFQGAEVIRTPVNRIAVNLAPFEAMLTALDSDQTLVAVGGAKSYNDAIRQRALNGELAKIGYGWHMPPTLDALLGSEPDVLLMAMGDLSHSRQLDRIRDLGVPVLPLFIDSEPHYMGKVEYIRLVGLLTGKNSEAKAYVDSIEQKVQALKKQAAAFSPTTMFSAWYSGSGRWMATVRNAEATLLRDANGKNLLEEPDDLRRDVFQKLSTESLILKAAHAECAIMRDSHSQPFRDEKTLQQFQAFRDHCVFAVDGMNKPNADAFDYYERAIIRPDLILKDLVHMLHPELRTDKSFNYIRPDTDLYE
ncbi:ABC transporter substrate-binding protein [Gilvimarinus agarilyticus]|uniref:ABC transporter substrate-binding protein n=1 Tax=Gilvimarinus sp. 2_MG-2023 TaxID=3062666 RepID=UPI001C0A1B5B|nr:ABC transporter substrate-binding protein [Gilvimarinus sp. 2_MG-2023]MBU2884369.1 ABC transporter substrate-binding protein [Gilvimarinus agarilyticus]MDO6569505.1 ABC transporter substrate-binding protein [Gilvimarinus sp. 2_MG-2023]